MRITSTHGDSSILSQLYICDVGIVSVVDLYQIQAFSLTGTTVPDMIFNIASASAKRIDIPDGWPFTNSLSLWCTQNEPVGDTTAPSGGNGNVLVTLVCS